MPSAYRVIFSPRSFADLNAILDYIEQDSPQQALKTLDRLWDGAQSLRDFPHRYPIYQAGARAKKETRTMPVSSFVVYFRIVERQRIVRVLTIRRGARRQPRRY